MLGVDLSARVQVPSAFPFYVAFSLVRYTMLLTGADVLYYYTLFFSCEKMAGWLEGGAQSHIWPCQLEKKGGWRLLG